LPFADNELTITHQHNAIKSWTLLEPKPEMLLLADEVGTQEAAQKYGCIHIPTVGKNELGDLSMQSIFRLIDTTATYDTIAYVDCDAILMSDFIPMIEYVTAHWDNFAVICGRLSVKLDHHLDFDAADWEDALRSHICRYHNHGTDYYVYRRGLYHDMPDFSIGCGAWDGWAIWYAMQKGAKLVNVHGIATVIHQDHGLRWRTRRGDGRQHNQRLAGKNKKWVSDIAEIRKDM
jgi:hypothetical protein